MGNSPTNYTDPSGDETDTRTEKQKHEAVDDQFKEILKQLKNFTPLGHAQRMFTRAKPRVYHNGRPFSDGVFSSEQIDQLDRALPLIRRGIEEYKQLYTNFKQGQYATGDFARMRAIEDVVNRFADQLNKATIDLSWDMQKTLTLSRLSNEQLKAAAQAEEATLAVLQFIVLDLPGSVPGFGAPFNALSAWMSYGRGNNVAGGMSLAGVGLPAVAWARNAKNAAKGARLLRLLKGAGHAAEDFQVLRQTENAILLVGKDGKLLVATEKGLQAIVPFNNGGVVNGAMYAQTSYSNTFSEVGRGIYSKLAGRPINTIDDLVAAIREGLVNPSQIEVNYIVRPGGNTLILNTRTGQALEQAGIPRSQWNAVNRTGDALQERLLSGQLQRNNLTNSGTASPVLDRGR
jgi:hypothetical protein